MRVFCRRRRAGKNLLLYQLNFGQVRGNTETMLFMMACTLLQMLGLEHLAAGYSPEESVDQQPKSEIFSVGIPASMKLSAPEAWLLNFAFFSPVLRRSGATCAEFLQQLRAAEAAGAAGAAAGAAGAGAGALGISVDHLWDSAARKIV